MVKEGPVKAQDDYQELERVPARHLFVTVYLMISTSG
jgi:hypothetical protein